MGRQAHTIRHALGLSSTLPPDWRALAPIYTELRSYVSQTPEWVAPSIKRRTSNVESSYHHCSQYPKIARKSLWTPSYRTLDPARTVAYGRLYDVKGRPTGSAMRDIDQKRCEAMNVVMQLSIRWFGDKTRIEGLG